jgi:chitin synthase
MAGLSQWGPGSVYGGAMPIHNPFLNGTPAASDYGGQLPMQNNSFLGVNNPYGMMGVMTGPRNSVMTNLNDFNGMGVGGAWSSNPALPPQRPQTLARPISTFSYATTANPFGGSAGPRPNLNENPSDEDIVQMISEYLATKDLMTVTKRQTREQTIGLFPNANLSDKVKFINESIDRLLEVEA